MTHMKKPIYSARLDGQPVRYTISEAWWIAEDGGPWREADLADVMHNGSMMIDEQFEKMFPNLPPLPSEAFR